MCENFQDCLESFRLSEMFSDCPETFKVVSFTYCLRKIPDCLETFQINCTLSWLCGKFTDYLESLKVVCKLSKFYVHFPCCMESSQSVLKVSRLWETFQNVCKFSDCPDSSFIFQKVSALCWMFLYHLESVTSFRQVKRVKRHVKRHFTSVVSMDCFLFFYFSLSS